MWTLPDTYFVSGFMLAVVSVVLLYFSVSASEAYCGRAQPLTKGVGITVCVALVMTLVPLIWLDKKKPYFLTWFGCVSLKSRLIDAPGEIDDDSDSDSDDDDIFSGGRGPGSRRGRCCAQLTSTFLIVNWGTLMLFTVVQLMFSVFFWMLDVANSRTKFCDGDASASNFRQIGLLAIAHAVMALAAAACILRLRRSNEEARLPSAYRLGGDAAKDDDPFEI